MKKWSFFKWICIIDIVAIVAGFTLDSVLNINRMSDIIFMIILGVFIIIGDSMFILLVKKLQVQQGITTKFYVLQLIVYILSCIVLFIFMVMLLIGIASTITDTHTYSPTSNEDKVGYIFAFIYFLALLIRVIFTIPLVSTVRKNNEVILVS
jgi:hypothetical protein